MLSAETAIGRYPVESVRMMARITREVEHEAAARHGFQASGQTHAHAIAHAAVGLAEEVKARAIVVFTRSGRTAQLVAGTRPAVPIYAFTNEPAVARHLALWWGVLPLVTEIKDNTDAMIEQVDRELAQRHLVEPGDMVVVVGSAPVLEAGRTNFVKLQTIGG
jgi:pyruvate kinase